MLSAEPSTAYYMFDAGTAKERTRLLRDTFGVGVRIAYAVKANTFIAGRLVPDVDRFEICSPGESEICDAYGIPDCMKVISGIYKDAVFIEKLVSSRDGAIYTVESLLQFRMLEDLAQKYGKKIKVLLRLTNGSQFGINRQDIVSVFENGIREHLDIQGIQYFSGTQKSSVKKIKREIREADGLLLELIRSGYIENPEFEYGPGLFVPYYEDDSYDEAAFLGGLNEALSEMESAPRVTLELGRGIAASCGRYYTHVVDVKRNCGVNYAIVDGGMHHIKYFGQFMGMRKPQLRVCGKENTDESALMNWYVCGALCSMDDILVKDIWLPELSVGDRICFENAGAYCPTEGISLFLSRELPAVYITDESGECALARESVLTAQFNCDKSIIISKR